MAYIWDKPTGVAVTRMRSCPDHPGLRRATHRQGQHPREIRRCLKRHIARQLNRMLTATMTLRRMTACPTRAPRARHRDAAGGLELGHRRRSTSAPSQQSGQWTTSRRTDSQPDGRVSLSRVRP